ncbi:MAG: helix-turn-helix domain-containing protein [Gaiellaceae bacterium]
MFEIGNSLREARLRKRLEFREVEQATKIRSRYLRALEEEDFEALPAETYVRGFLRAYAESLGLNGQLYVDEYNSRFVTGEGSSPLRPRRSQPPRRGKGRGIETNVILFALTAIAVMTALVIVAWKFSSETPPAAEPARKTVTQPNRPAKRAKPPAVRVTPAKLRVTASGGHSWLQVHESSATGRLLYQGTLEKGRTQRFVAARLWVNAGRPENLRLTLNGSPVSIGARSPVVVLITANSVTPASTER